MPTPVIKLDLPLSKPVVRKSPKRAVSPQGQRRTFDQFYADQMAHKALADQKRGLPSPRAPSPPRPSVIDFDSLFAKVSGSVAKKFLDLAQFVTATELLGCIEASNPFEKRLALIAFGELKMLTKSKQKVRVSDARQFFERVLKLNGNLGSEARHPHVQKYAAFRAKWVAKRRREHSATSGRKVTQTNTPRVGEVLLSSHS